MSAKRKPLRDPLPARVARKIDELSRLDPRACKEIENLVDFFLKQLKLAGGAR